MTATNGKLPHPLPSQSDLQARLAELEHENTQLRRRASLDNTLLAHGPTVLFRWVCAPDWPVEYVSPNITNLLGYTHSDFTSGRIPYSSVVHPDDLARVAAEVQDYSETGAETFEQEYRLLHTNGEIRWIYDFTIVERDERGAITHYVGYVLDITARKQAEETLQERTRFFEAVIDHMPVSVFVKDARDMRFVMWNKTAEQVMGYSSAEALGNTHHAFFPPEQAAILDRQDHDLLASGEPVDLPCITFNSKILGQRLLHTIKVPVYDNAGKPLCVLGISEDITKHRQMEEDLAQQSQLLNNLLNTLPFPAFYKDHEGVYRGCNRAFAEDLMGRSISEVVGRTQAELLSGKPVEIAAEADQRLLTQGGAVVFEHDVRYANGQMHSVIFHLSAFARPDGTPGGVVGAMLDITDHKQAETEKSALQQQIIEAQQASIRELSAPLLPLADHVIALPLIGTIDDGRAQHITETLLEGITSQQADVAIIDITGVQMVDTQVANAIIRAAKAVKLLGAQVVLTGIRPEVAQTLVQLGINLGGIVTHSTLQAAIGYAMENH